jgi:hypothetical protein
MAKEDVLFAEWLAETKESFGSDDERAQFEKFATGTAGKAVFKGYLREKDYHRALNDANKKQREVEAKETELAGKYNEIDQWYAINAPVNEQLKKEKSELTRKLEEAQRELTEVGLGDVRGRGEKSAVVDDLEKRLADEQNKRDALEKRVIAIDTNFPAVLENLLDVSHRITKEGYSVSPKEVLQHSLRKRLSPLDALNELTADEREKREQARWTKELEKAKEEGRREERKSNVASPDRLKQSNPFFETLQKKMEQTSKYDRRSEAVNIFLEEDAEAV